MILNPKNFVRILRYSVEFYLKSMHIIEEKYKFDYTESMSIYNFGKNAINLHKEYLDLDWVFDYLNFQFTSIDYLKDTLPNFQFKAQNVIGEKALKKYIAKKYKNTYYYHSSFLPKYQITKENLLDYLVEKGLVELNFDLKEEKVKENPLNKVEEERKQLKYNTDKGFIYCLSYTSLYKFNSQLCQECCNKEKCKKVLKKKYPILYQKRFANYLNAKGKNGK